MSRSKEHGSIGSNSYTDGPGPGRGSGFGPFDATDVNCPISLGLRLSHKQKEPKDPSKLRSLRPEIRRGLLKKRSGSHLDNRYFPEPFYAEDEEYPDE